MTSAVAAQQADLALQALTVALQHTAVAADQRNMCTLLQVCKAWRAAAQQSAASLTHVTLSSVMLGESLLKLSSFTEWLAKHPGLIRTLQIHGFLERDRQGGYAAGVLVARQLVELGMQTAAASRVGAHLRLRSFNSSLPATAALLATLPAASLTHLDVRLDSSNCFSSISSLSSLRYMKLNMSDTRAEAANRCLSEIGRLQQLIKLELCSVAAEADMQLLPAQLQQLRLDYRSSSVSNAASAGCRPKLQHLTSLQELQLAGRQLAAGSSVPPNLQSLAIAADWPADGLEGLSSLHQLTLVKLHHFEVRSHHLAAFEQLPQLRNLTLGLLGHDEHLLEVAAVWHKVPLCCLYICNMTLTPIDLRQLMQHVPAATKLTQLCCSVAVDINHNEQHDLAVCEHLKSLKNLRSLSLSIGGPGHFAVQDAEHLSALVTLTSLDLCNMGAGLYVDATTLSLLALKLTQLKELAINATSGEQRVGTSALPVIGQLTTLETLSFKQFNQEEAQRGLQLLTGLTRLQQLRGFEEAGEEALRVFWEVIRSKQQ